MGSKHTQTPHRSRGRLGSYDLLYTLGVGGFGRVYLGEHIHLHSRAAVKVLHSAFVNDQAEKFKHEAQLVAQLAPHPHIVRVLDYNVQHGHPYIVMDYVSHGNLRQRHTFGAKVPLSTVVSYVKQLANGLQHAHNSNIVHCDVKPENMFLGKQGKVLIGDFGIAVSLQEENAQSEDTFGTVSYMAPEQILGNPQPASDQYALAVVVYEWLTGEHPITGSDKSEIANKHLHEQPQSMRTINPAIPLAVEQVVMKALDKDPSRRYSSISNFAQAFEGASRAGRTARAQQAPSAVNSLVRRPTRPPHLCPLRSILLLLFISLILLGILVPIYLLYPVAIVTITEIGLAQTWGDHISTTIGGGDSVLNPVAAHIETITTAPQKNTVPTTGEQHVSATQAYGQLTFFNSDIVPHLVPAGTVIAVPHSNLQVITDEDVTIPAGNLSESGQVDVHAHVVQAGADGNIAAHTLYGSPCCSSDNIRVDNLNSFSGGQNDQIYSIVQQSDIQGAANPLEKLQTQSAPSLLQKQAQSSDILVTSTVQCTPTVSSDAAVGSRVTSITVTVKSTCTGDFYNIEAVNSLVVKQFIEHEDQRLGHNYVHVGNVKIDVTKVSVQPASKRQTLVLDVGARGVWLFNFNKVQKEQLLRAIASKKRGQAYSQLMNEIHRVGVNMIVIRFSWDRAGISDDWLPSDFNRIRLVIVQK